MKQISILLSATLLLISSFSFAGGKKGGDKFNGIVKYKISTEGREITPTEQAQMPSESVFYYFENLVRNDNVTPMGSMITITNTDTKEFTLLLDQMGQKYHFSVSAEDMKKVEEKAKDSIKTKPTFNLLEGSKTIAGYTCKKGEMLSKDTKIEFYYTEDIKAEQKEFKGAPGFVLSYSVNMPDDDLVLVYQATEIILKKAKKKDFAIPSDYEAMPDAYVTQIRSSMGL